MSEQLTCLGHENGFQHLDVKLGGPEHDLGFKFEEKESAGLAEPVLTLYVSVKDPRRKDSHPTTLHYGLTRSEFAKSHCHAVSYIAGDVVTRGVCTASPELGHCRVNLKSPSR
ncbi:MAG: hypothetical protein ABSA97_12810 [Verrucomicrobiia bacterium]